jgi:homoserine dehydrogenase
MLNIAIAGLGTVGAGVVRLLQTNGELIAARAGQPINIKAISARDKGKKRDCDLSGIVWVDDVRKLAEMPGVDAVVELIGGADGIARELAEVTLKKGRSYITANKALIAAYGRALARLAEQNKAQLLFEASVAGGIPVIKALREGLAGNRIRAARGILNGTCNYILSRMREAKISFAEALAEAQAKGYAEADPAGDIDGHDTANKLAILTALAYGVEPDLTAMSIAGIRPVTPADIQAAEEIDCRIKLLGLVEESDGGIAQQVSPCLVPKSSLLAQTEGVMNAVLLRGDFVGDLALQGRGAGAEPTASAVVADIIDLARGLSIPAFGVKAAQLKKARFSRHVPARRMYLRVPAVDKSGALVDIAAALRTGGVTVEKLLPPEALVLGKTDPAVLSRAVAKLGAVFMMPIMD